MKKILIILGILLAINIVITGICKTLASDFLMQINYNNSIIGNLI